MWTGDIYRIVYEIIEQLDYNCSIFIDRHIDKNVLFLKEPDGTKEFYKNWFKELTTKYIKLETVYSQFQCKHCASHPLQLQLAKEKLIIIDYCKECQIYLDMDSLVENIKREDTAAGRMDKARKEAAERRASDRRYERMQREAFVSQYFEALHNRAEREKEKKEKYQARLEEQKKIRAQRRKARERYRAKLEAEGKTITRKVKVGRKKKKQDE